MTDSPCHYCPKCPCKEHDTCKDFREYREGILAASKKDQERKAVIDATCIAVRRCKRKR